MALVCVRLFPVPLGFVATGQHGKGAAADFGASATAPSISNGSRVIVGFFIVKLFVALTATELFDRQTIAESLSA